MLTLDSKFSEFISLCALNGACSGKGDAIPTMEEANKGFGMVADGTCKDGFELYLNSAFPESWAQWVLENVGKEMDEKCREYFVKKIKEPMGALQILTRVDFSSAEQTVLKKVYEGKLPTAEKEIRDGIVSLKAAVK
jgi:hypothetical protein